MIGRTLREREDGPCPGCGSREHVSTYRDCSVEWATCDECDWASPIKVWNRRTPDAASEKLRREVAFRLGEVASQLLVMPDIHAKALARQLDREAAKLLEGLEAETEGK